MIHKSTKLYRFYILFQNKKYIFIFFFLNLLLIPKSINILRHLYPLYIYPYMVHSIFHFRKFNRLKYQLIQELFVLDTYNQERLYFLRMSYIFLSSIKCKINYTFLCKEYKYLHKNSRILHRQRQFCIYLTRHHKKYHWRNKHKYLWRLFSPEFLIDTCNVGDFYFLNILNIFIYYIINNIYYDLCRVNRHPPQNN